MAKARIAALALLTGLIFVAGCKSGGSMAEQTQPLTIQARVHGSDPGFKQVGVSLFTSRAELVSSGSQDLLSKLNIDFATHSVVVLTLGRCETAGYWGRIVAVQGTESDVYIQGVANAPAPGSHPAAGVNYPYDAVVIPKVKPSVMIHSDIRSIAGQEDTPAAAVAVFMHPAK